MASAALPAFAEKNDVHAGIANAQGAVWFDDYAVDEGNGLGAEETKRGQKKGAGGEADGMFHREIRDFVIPIRLGNCNEAPVTAGKAKV